MAIPVLHLNLVPAPTLWRRRHPALSWALLLAGSLALASILAVWAVQAARATSAARDAVQLSNRARQAAQQEMNLQQELSAIDVAQELPRWRLAERIYQERSLPWSRGTAELERSLVDGVRLKALSRTRATDGSVEMKLRGEGRTRGAEVEFVEQLQHNGLFSQVILEREAERQGGGVDFELRLPLVPVPPPYQPLPPPGSRKAAKPEVKR